MTGKIRVDIYGKRILEIVCGQAIFKYNKTGARSLFLLIKYDYICYVCIINIIGNISEGAMHLFFELLCIFESIYVKIIRRVTTKSTCYMG